LAFDCKHWLSFTVERVEAGAQAKDRGATFCIELPVLVVTRKRERLAASTHQWWFDPANS